ncbi:hypothetical protein AVEN_128920-1 [Araneus ventricosus]|uniref:Uncharacterized protein n=1 Tax=Araneus ventricosus TaxID=182803 RepID=A0A4Y2PQL9_ARAVE|nr:hypothetical protein AVEN_65536-1 [Araneus ventricosus]GBN54205.1 hypothetical protein AVEN_128920-1 [Araneus ventricosus]
MYGSLTGRRLPFLIKTTEEGLKISAEEEMDSTWKDLFAVSLVKCWWAPVPMSLSRPGEEREEIPLFSASAQHSKLCSVLAKEKTIIPARSECLIQGAPEVSGKFRYTVTDLLSQVSQKDILLAATLVDLKREAIPVQVLNRDNKHKTVDKGAIIAMSEPVVDIVARPQEFSESLRLPSIL